MVNLFSPEGPLKSAEYPCPFNHLQQNLGIFDILISLSALFDILISLSALFGDN